ncbi:MAG: archaemetzincin family Zn-dependent metalloprotease [Candidatus Bathyarchaeia archaeon]
MASNNQGFRLLEHLTIHLLQIGEVEEEVINRVLANLESVFGVCRVVRSRGETQLLQAAYNEVRRQYNAEVILERLSKTVKPLGGADRVLALLCVDIYAGRLNFIFGQAQCPGRFAVVSTYRLRPEFYHVEDCFLFVARVVKEVTHELGHTFGIKHCTNPRCVMCFSNSVEMVDGKNSTFCPSCQSMLWENVRRTSFRA